MCKTHVKTDKEILVEFGIQNYETSESQWNPETRPLSLTTMTSTTNVLFFLARELHKGSGGEYH